MNPDNPNFRDRQNAGVCPYCDQDISHLLVQNEEDEQIDATEAWNHLLQCESYLKD